MPARNESPPAKIAHGTATIAGLGGALALLVPIIVDLLSNEKIPAGTRNLLLICATALAVAVILIRGAQAVAVELTRGQR